MGKAWWCPPPALPGPTERPLFGRLEEDSLSFFRRFHSLHHRGCRHGGRPLPPHPPAPRSGPGSPAAGSGCWPQGGPRPGSGARAAGSRPGRAGSPRPRWARVPPPSPCPASGSHLVLCTEAMVIFHCRPLSRAWRGEPRGAGSGACGPASPAPPSAQSPPAPRGPGRGVGSPSFVLIKT